MSFLLCLRHHALLVLGDVDAVSHGLRGGPGYIPGR
jgi:hypothetical protein